MEVTDNSIGDAPVLSGLLDQIPSGKRIGSVSVSGDGAYDTKDCYDAIASRAADAIILTPKNASPGRPIAAVRMRATTSCRQHAGWAERSGKVECISSTQPCRN